MPISLRKRFFLSSAVVLVLVMLLSAIIVDWQFQEKLQHSNKEKMKLHIYTLLSIAELTDAGFSLPDILQDERFNQLSSGFIAKVVDVNDQSIWTSLSFNDSVQAIELSEKTGEWTYGSAFFQGEKYLTLSYLVSWQVDEQQHLYHFQIAQSLSNYNNEVFQFRTLNYSRFFIVTLCLFLCQLAALNFSFRPIERLENEVRAMESGSIKALADDYPKELIGVTKNFNALLDKEYRQREKYRLSMADLAHSLKTPMAIIRTEIQQKPDNIVLLDALQRADQTIEYQLRRAVISGHSLVNNAVNILHVLNMVGNALEKIYHHKNVELHANIDESLLFRGDENDLMEIFGNLLDNAFKYSHSEITVSAYQKEQGLIINITDDGEGFKDGQSQRIFNRGERLDRQDLGQGIGLAVVLDIVKSYGGTITACNSPGASFTIVFS